MEQKQKGISLVLTIVVVSIAMAIVLGLTKIFVSSLIASYNIHQSVIAFYVSDAGIEAALFRDRNGVGVPPVGIPPIAGVVFTCNSFTWDGDTCLASLDNGGTYVYTVTDFGGFPNDRKIESTGEYNKVKRTIEASYERNP